MRVIIFIDKQNFDGALNFINEDYPEGQKRFWNIDKYIPFLLEKIKNLDRGRFDKEGLNLIKTFIYTGRYNRTIIDKIKLNCNKKIREIQEKINTESKLLGEINRLCKNKCNFKEEKINEKITQYMNKNIQILEEEKEIYRSRLNKQIRNREGQKGFFKKVERNPFIDLRTTLLKQADGKIHQKGVDVNLAIDLVNLAHTKSYDIALILGGDSDLAEALRLVKESLSKTIIVVAYYTKGECLLSNVSDLKKIAGKNFLNLKDFSREEIEKMSNLKRFREKNKQDSF